MCGAGARYQRFPAPLAGFLDGPRHVARNADLAGALPALPSVEVARPNRCPSCGSPARLDGQLLLYGHGVRWRSVVLPNDADPPAAIVLCWTRRFLCRRCSATCTVGPPGVLPRRLYTLAAIVTAWLLALDRPLGDGLDQVEVCARQGVDRRPGATAERRRSGHRRWRSLPRWAARIPTWWSSRPVTGSTWREVARELLVGFVAGGSGRDGLRARAVAAHASPGAAM